MVKKNYPWIVSSRKYQVESIKGTTPYKSYLHLGEKVDPKIHIIADFVLGVEKRTDFEEVAGGVAAESSVGTWTRVETEIKEVFDRLHARVLVADKESGFLQIAYPLDLFEAGNIPQLLSSVAGNIFGLREVKNLKLLDLILPGKYVQSFAGPALGIDGIRKLTGVFDRPLIGCIIKPKLGLDARAHAQVVRDVFEGGVDFVKDDENLTSQAFNPFEKRVKEICSNVFFSGKQKTSDYFNNRVKQWNKKRVYAFNVTAPTEIMTERAKLVKDKGGNCVMVDFLTAGFAAVQTLRHKNSDLIIHGHRAMHAAFDRFPNHGISMLVLGKLARLAGVDSLHTGTVVGKMEGEKEEVRKINQFLLSEWYGVKPVLPVASGGLHPGLIPDLVKILGKEVLLNFGGGIHGHPNGPRAGAVAVMSAVEATQKGIPLLEYGKTNEELAIALEHWNVERSGGEK
ncbi:ribulose-bisphosphate carboxylase large subunit [Candidatus Gottesmanbacteria bacterium]|nr:ribulose-bisphosphate carboxylase large subunit [Candidatus Gottesmanbacteria bacterium]